ncbi:MAG: putative lipid II flippase FtsW [Gammaproteobacteria bacterium]|jgi:cell division protein FtsW
MTVGRSSRLAPAVPIEETDRLLVLVVAAIVGLGLLMVVSASITAADRELGQPFFYLTRQIIYLGIGIGVALGCLLVPMDVWERSSPIMLIVAYLLLAAVLIPGVGREVNGSTRWLPLGPVNLQVSEPARLLILVFVAGYVARRSEELATTASGFFKPVSLVLLACLLLLMEPDFGAATVLMATAMAVLFAGGVRLKYFLLLAVPMAAGLAALALMSPYRLRRLTAFLDPWSDPYDSGFQLTQSLIAIGRGEVGGVGLGGSVQKLFYLPEAHTDFVFAVFAEEFGLLGVVILVALYGVLVWRIMSVSSRCAGAGALFPACLTFGLGAWLGAQAIVNIGVNMGLLPTKGLTLPLMSFGGSSLITCCAAIGIILRADLEQRRLANRPKGRARRVRA